MHLCFHPGQQYRSCLLGWELQQVRPGRQEEFRPR